ncbi:FtsB family cell division protein [Palleronia caenipelagi]|uniref:Septum formation initiator family protein n=1 Tax=Palleronia caenipelagi TaxID=2489174 RepID=A0A547Q044_9RHOB|nr:septum formation initiator family protein [Palleronia caenipelagi]TRD19772.1 septum formation initiator family protein [Palleronia caenipelagi]
MSFEYRTDQDDKSPALGMVLYLAVTFVLACYFTFASLQGDFGMLRRAQIDAEAAQLETDLAELRAEIEALRNKTVRLSDNYLDLDLLDERARDLLGYIREDEVALLR